MEEVAERVNLQFLVNTILNRGGQIKRVVAGDTRKAFRVGVEEARSTYTVRIPGRADVVIASAFPSDANFWQAGKALYSADLAVRQGGIIILVSPCNEGIGEHSEFAGLCAEKVDEIRSRVMLNKVVDRIGAAAALAVAEVRSRAEIWIVTEHLSCSDTDTLCMKRYTSLQNAVDDALRKIGKTAKVMVLHGAVEMVPVIATEANQSA
jgi:nickel-dependent lactate racemase